MTRQGALAVKLAAGLEFENWDISNYRDRARANPSWNSIKIQLRFTRRKQKLKSILSSSNVNWNTIEGWQQGLWIELIWNLSILGSRATAAVYFRSGRGPNRWQNLAFESCNGKSFCVVRGNIFYSAMANLIVLLGEIHLPHLDLIDA